MVRVRARVSLTLTLTLALTLTQVGAEYRCVMDPAQLVAVQPNLHNGQVVRVRVRVRAKARAKARARAEARARVRVRVRARLTALHTSRARSVLPLALLRSRKGGEAGEDRG